MKGTREGKATVLVTGAGTGLGREMALMLAEKGFEVYAGLLLEDQWDPLRKETKRRGVDLRILSLDVTQQDSIRSAVETIVGEQGVLSAVINNAGVSLRGYFEDCDEGEVRRLFDVNLFGAMSVTRAALPHMRKAGEGRILFVSSVGGRIASMARTSYCSSKFALEGFAESLFQEVSPLGIQVSLIEPAIIKTERWSTNRGIAKNALNPNGVYLEWFKREEELADRLVESSPTTPEDVARVVHRALTVKRPRLRYVVGYRAKIAILLRRKLPGEWFEKLFFGLAIRQVVGRR